MIDFHCHLDLYQDPVQIVRECAERGLYVLSVTTTPTAWTRTNALASGHQRIRTALGLHPQLAAERKSELPLFDELLPSVRYVGEIGLDGSPELRDHWQDQIVVFEHILDACRSAGGRVMSIHSRRAAAAVVERIADCTGAGVPVLHWYSGSRRELDKAVQAGCWFSVGLPMMSSKNGQELIRRMPMDRVLTETDGPFTTIDGRPALPWDVESIIQRLADIWSIEHDAADGRLRQNLRNLLRS